MPAFQYTNTRWRWVAAFCLHMQICRTRWANATNPGSAESHAITPQGFPLPSICLRGAFYHSWGSFARPQNCPTQEGFPPHFLPRAEGCSHAHAPEKNPCRVHRPVNGTAWVPCLVSMQGLWIALAPFNSSKALFVCLLSFFKKTKTQQQTCF